jgi:hypothetical protein
MVEGLRDLLGRDRRALGTTVRGGRACLQGDLICTALVDVALVDVALMDVDVAMALRPTVKQRPESGSDALAH